MVKSPCSDIEIPEVPIHQIVLQSMEMFQDRVALVDGITERECTYGELIDSIKKVASALTRRGLKQREILAMFSPNSIEFIIMFYATLACGASVTTINPVYTEYELRKHLEDSKAKFLFASPETAGTAIECAKKLGLQQTSIVSGSFPGCITVDELLSDDGSLFPENLDINVREDVATIPYSSGTTGFPKGVMITHYNIVAMIMQFGHPDLVNEGYGDSTEQNVTVAIIPFFHAYGMVALVVAALLKGDKLVILPRFLPERFLQVIEKYKVTGLPLVPPVIIFLTNSPLVKKYDLSSVKIVASGAAPLSKDTERDFVKMLKVQPIRQGYGMTETTVACAYPLGTRPTKPGSSGVPLANSEMQIVDPNTKNILGVGEQGEIWVKGPNIMKGYLNRPDATRETLDSDGWLHTGDVGYYDENSYFYIVDRMKELIKYKGFQVAPAELEGLLLNHPSIDDAAVIGIPDAAAGEIPRAYVVRKSGAQLTEDDVKKYVSDHMSSFKHLRGGVEFTQTIPKSQSGKILRREIRDQLKKSRL